MAYNKQIYRVIILLALTLVASLAACSKQNWYTGAQSSKKAQCMKQPVSEYNDCINQSSESYDEYNKSRQALKENSATK